MILTFLFTLTTAILSAPNMEVCYIPESEPLFIKETLSWASINYWLIEYDVKQIDVVKAQIRLETGNLSSRYCRERNNLFGMKKPRKRQTTAIGRDKSMAVYSHFSESIRDYAYWQDLFYKGGDYYQFLKRHGYATDKKYVEKLKLINN